MKKILSMMLVFLLACTQFVGVTFATDAPTVTVDKEVEAAAGETVDVYFTLADNGVAVKNYAISAITYDTTALELVSGEVVAIGSPTIAEWDATNKNLAVTYREDQDSCSGKILKLTFKVSDSASWGTYEISATAKVNQVAVTLESGSIVVPGPTVTIDSNVTVKLGETADVYFTLADNGIAVKNYAISAITYDTTALELVSGEVVAIGSPTIAEWDATNKNLAVTYREDQDSCSGKILKLTFKAKEDAEVGTYAVTATAKVNQTEVTVNAGSLVVTEEQIEEDWSAITPSTITYGQNVGEAFELPESGTVTIDGTPYTGTYSITDSDVVPDAGEATVEVVLTISQEGTPRTFTKEYTVTVIVADYDMTSISAADYEAEYIGGVITYSESNVTMPDDVTITGITYTDSNSEPVDEPTDVGTYTVTVSFETSDTNYNDPENVTAEFEITKATATSIEDEDVSIAATAEEMKDIEDIDALLSEIEAQLPETVVVNFGQYQADATVTDWTTEDTWNVKGGTYTFIAVLENDNLDLSAVEYKAVVTVSAVNGTIVATPEINNVTISKAQAEAASTFADFDLPEQLTVTYDGGETELIDIVWTKTVADIQDEAADVTDDNNVTVEVSINMEETLADYEWLTIAEGATATITITSKKVATFGEFTVADVIYGTEIEATEPGWTAQDGGEDSEATVAITYRGTGDTVYEESETKPTTVGTYVATATLVSNDYAAVATDEFAITPREIEYTVDDKARDYGDENPEFTGGITDGELAYDDEIADLNIVMTTNATADFAAGSENVKITATYENANYTVTIVEGTLTINKKSLTGIEAPVISGTAKVGMDLTAEIELYGNTEGVAYQWYRDGAEIDGATAQVYRLTPADSNAEITVKVTADAATNYSDETPASEAVTVEKYEISGTVSATADTERVEAGSVLTSDITGIANYEQLGELTYEWKINDEVAGTEATLTIPDTVEAGDVITLTVTPSDDYTGSIELTVATVGKAMLTGSVALAYDGETATTDTVITATVTSDVDAANYDIVWLADGIEIEGAEGTTYTVTAADLGKNISAKIVAKADSNYTGEVSATAVAVPALAPTVTFETTQTTSSITVKLNAEANGAEISDVEITITDAEEDSETVNVDLDENGEAEYTFTGLDAAATYTITVTATNAAGTTTETDDVTTTRRTSGIYYIDGPDKDEEDETDEGDTTEPGTDVEDTTDFFVDVAEGSWYYDDVVYAVENGLFNGTTATTFAPNAAMTRAMLVTVLYRAEGTPEVETDVAFEDVADDAYYAAAVAWAQKNGIVKGYSDTEFKPDNNILREQMAAIIYRYAAYKGYDVSAAASIEAYIDASSISEYAVSAMQYAVGSGLINGKTEITLNPADNTTRAEVAAILNRFFAANN